MDWIHEDLGVNQINKLFQISDTAIQLSKLRGKIIPFYSFGEKS